MFIRGKAHEPSRTFVVVNKLGRFRAQARLAGEEDGERILPFNPPPGWFLF